MCILLLTNSRDLTIDFLVKELSSRKVKFFRLDTDKLNNSLVSVNPVSNEIEYRSSFSTIRIDEVKAAYFRRPSYSPPEHTADGYKDYVRGEWNALLKTIYTTLEGYWLNDPFKIFVAEDKSTQLRLAHRLGFNVPDTVITNDCEVAKKFIGDDTYVAKTLRQSIVEHNKIENVIYTSKIDQLTDNDEKSIEICPIIFQRFLDKAVDIRVTVVGNQVFAVAIHSQANEVTKVDWRRGTDTSLVHQIIELPEDLRDKCIRIVQMLGLRFSAIDLVKDKNGEYWFLECNPNGQWAWIEVRTALPLASAIVDELIIISAS